VINKIYELKSIPDIRYLLLFGISLPNTKFDSEFLVVLWTLVKPDPVGINNFNTYLTSNKIKIRRNF
jgi:hypothetical protein